MAQHKDKIVFAGTVPGPIDQLSELRRGPFQPLDEKNCCLRLKARVGDGNAEGCDRDLSMQFYQATDVDKPINLTKQLVSPVIYTS
ncbi:MAG: hypothetical protein E5Y00_27845 [Mesorhizobium sp.]|nr:MAG: hypothetical protein E5Y00_27845 [Mesorhizobium sp.]TIP31792.1 MAG: hypothetical protein E5X90_11120 [Mesorhizobium sp.]